MSSNWGFDWDGKSGNTRRRHGMKGGFGASPG
jgi:hypothetical protein